MSMAPGGPGKRKRGDRSYSGDSRDDGTRPSPHRPDQLSLAQRTQQYPPQNHYGRGGYNDRGRGGRRGSRGGMSHGSQRSPVTSPTSAQNAHSSFDQFRPPSSQGQQSAPSAPQNMMQSQSIPGPPPKFDEPRKEEPPLQLPPMEYEYLTDKIVESWSEDGRNTVLDKSFQARDAQDSLVMTDIFQEVIRSCAEKRIDPSTAGGLVKEILGNQDDSDHIETDQLATFDSSSLFLDALSVFVETFSFSPFFTTLVQAAEIPSSKIRRELDTTLLESLGLIRNTFTRIGIRQQTNLLYRQSNYNLLREETEGYSKLVTEFFTTSNNELPTSDVVEETFERVRGMIGAFDLDVGRVLDITLDVFAAVLIKQYSFFLKYLRASSWWPQNDFANLEASEHSLGPLPKWALPGFERQTVTDDERDATSLLRTQRDVRFWRRCKEKGLPAFFELGGREVAEPILEAALAQSNDPQSAEETEDHKWIRLTKTLPPSGNKVAAQVLGFKLRFYISSARDQSDVFPANLIYLAALLVKIGFISLRDLYPHIWPEDSSMEQVKEAKIKENTEKPTRSGGIRNALLDAAPLPDDTIEPPPRESSRLKEADAVRRQKTEATNSRLTPSVHPDEKTDDLPEPTDQKVLLLRSLLCIGALPEALYMLGRFPWLPEVFTDLPEYIHRILHHCLSKVYEAIRPLKNDERLQQPQRYADTEQGGVLKGQVKLADMPPRRTLRWAQLDKLDHNDLVDYRFYWDDWADIIPMCEDIDHVFLLCSTLLNYSGVKIGQDPALLTKIARIGRHSISVDSSDGNLARWVDLSKRLLVPALSLTKCNPGVVNEVFELIKNFSESTRYSIYAEWNMGQISRTPDIKAAFEQTKAETRDVLKRISKTTIKPMGRALARVAYPSPGVVFSVAISQLESYENIVDTFVECARYFTYLAYDVLTWSLMSFLGAQGRNRLQSDGLLTSKWLSSLALFAGKVFKRYSVMNPLPIVRYVENQLRNGNPTDLIILEEIIRSMAGIVPDVNLSEQQVQGLSGGKHMRTRTLEQLMDRRKELESTTKRLIKPLIDSHLAGQVLISLAQERQTCIFHVDEDNAHPKLLGNLFDQVQRIFSQYLELLRTSVSTNTFDEQVPDVIRLIADFGLDPGIAFWVCRDSTAAVMKEYDAQNPRLIEATQDPKNAVVTEVDLETAQSTETLQGPSAEQKDADSQEDRLISASNEIKDDPTRMTMDVDPETTTTAVAIEPPATAQAIPEEATQPQSCHPMLQGVASQIIDYLPSKLWEVVEPSFYVTFWQSTLPDIHVPSIYLNESKRLLGTVKDQGTTKAATSKTQDEKVEFDLIRAEMILLMGRTDKTRLKLEKDHWFIGGRKGMWRCEARHNLLIEHCFFPRLIMSPFDSLFTFQMIKWLHMNGAAVFRTMGLYDQLFREKRLTSMIFMCSSKEAEYLGRFLNNILSDFSAWHEKKAKYDREALGGTTGTRHGFYRLEYDKDNDVETEKPLEYEDFRRLLLKWHRNLNGALKACFTSGEYMHIRNAINILNTVVQHFPVINWMGSNQLALITELSKNETREDLKIASTSLIAALKNREKKWVLPQAFSLQNESGQSGSRPTRPDSVQPPTPQPDAAPGKALNPKAPDFKPTASDSVNGEEAVSSAVTGKNDAEDGEINDVSPTAKEIPTAESKPQKEAVTSASKGVPVVQAKGTAQTDGGQDTPQRSPDLSKSQAVAPAPTARTVTKETLPQPVKASPAPQVNGDPSLPPRSEHAHRRQPELQGRTRLDDRLPNTNARDLRSVGSRDLDSERAPQERQSNVPPRVPPAENRYRQAASDDGYSRPPPDRHSALNDRPTRATAAPPTVEDYRQEYSHPPRPRDLRDASIAHSQRGNPHQPSRAGFQGPPDASQEPYSRYQNERQASDRQSRGSSPTRTDARLHSFDRAQGPIDNRQPYDDRSTHPRYEDSTAPSGPRSDRQPMGPPGNAHERYRDTRVPPSAPPVDPNYGRLRQEQQSARQPETYGRLNAEPDVPAGPRVANGAAQPAFRTPRASNGSNMSNVSNQHQPSGVSQSSAPPPSMNRQMANGNTVRSSPRNASNPNAAASAPANSQTPDTPSIHPDRLRAIQGVGPPLTTNAGPMTRGGVRPAPNEVMSHQQDLQRRQDEQYQVPPGPGASGRGPPTGPSDRRGDKRFTGVQSILQQTNSQSVPERAQQGTSIRGRGGRNHPQAGSGPPTPSASFPPQEAFERQTGPAPFSTDDNAHYTRNFRSGPQDPERRSIRQRSYSPSGRSRPEFRNGRENDIQPTRDDLRSRYANEGPPVNPRGGAGSDLRGSVPPVSMGRELRSGPPRRGERDDAQIAPDRRDTQDWGGDRRPPMGRRDERDGRDGGGSFRKRDRPDEGYVDRSMDNKRPRRGA